MKWPMLKLHDICRPKQWPTISSGKLTGSGFPVYGANGRIGYYPEFNHAEPTILITCRGATCGTINICEPKSYVTGNSMALDDLDDRINLHFLAHYLRNRGLVDVISGSAQPQITREGLTKIRVPVPSLDEQRRIAAILDQAEALRAKRSQALAKLDTLTQSLFLEMFGKDEVLRSRWEIAPISTLGQVTTGRTPPGERDGMFDGPVPFVTPGDLDDVMEEGAKRSLTLLGATHVRLARAGATAVCCIGATIGKMGMPKTDFAFNQQINVVEWGKRIDDVYGYFAIRQLKEEIVSRGASTTMPILKKSAFEQLFLPVPPLSMQRDFRAKIESLWGRRSSFRQQEIAMNSLFSSLQSVAFSGGL